MKNRVLIVYLALATISLTKSQSCRRQGNVTLSEANEGDIRVGRVYFCRGNTWRAVCGDDWDLNAARVVCMQLRFPPQGAQVYSFNTEVVPLEPGSLLANIGFRCTGNESLLSRCRSVEVTSCTSFARVLCVMPCQEPLPPECPNIPTITTPKSTACNCTATPANTPAPVTDCAAERTVTLTLVGISALLLLTLLGMVIGWVWFCHRKKKARSSENMQHNPAYTMTTITTNYSSTGPQDMPSGHATAQGQEETVSSEKSEKQEGEGRIYHVLEHPGSQKEDDTDKEGVYHMIEEVGERREGMEYEVPIQTKSKGRNENSE